MRTDDFGFTLVNMKKIAYQNEPFIMEEQAKQLFYVQDPCYEKWSVVLQRKKVGVMLKKMMIQSLILVSILSPHKCRLTSTEKKLTASSQIVMIMMKEN